MPRNLLLVASLLITAAAQGGSILTMTYNWSADGSESDQLGRLSRNGVQSTWPATKPTPLLFNTTPNDYTLFTLNSGVYSHIEVTITQLTEHNVYSAAYSIFNPNDPTANYLADAGLSSGVPPTPFSYQFILPTGTNFEVVLSTVNGITSAANGSTQVLVEGFLDANRSEAPEPASVILMGCGVGVLSLFSRFRRA
jgi:hypothetical protein